ncbi:MAG: hypothetical protein AABY22_27460 [Nanoarchaeota archaeon]
MKTNINIEEIARQRLGLQTVQKNIFNYFKIQVPTINKFKDPAFLNQFKDWDFDKQKQLIIELGGPTNYRFTKYWINGLIRNLNKEKK